MEAAAKRKEAYVEYDPTTRVYSYSGAAVAEAMPQTAPVRDNTTRTRVEQHPTPVKRGKQRTGRRVLAIFTVLAIGVVVMTLMIRYARIANCYTEINGIKRSITLAQQDIASLNVELNSSVNIDEARAAALAAGMGYPSAEQIVDVEAASKTVMTDGEQP